ncbi:hypothetical protein [Aeromicrobium duanguangcaii]|uniref:O-antigen ligase domain-containing protein n=1 Tax=Aeromicrobium duanguangcaii TaxID=2968086 RepID=A0ABY5KGJ8_9ACTN|nr:hypothetical protein [Aeromicrobium duanguangcaii]MCD9155443.1 hypothetical protein [Aeromicrobium duanguangcaii]UUI69118.1 hypothetical protein NP095_03150 [Aeromicrobium duanguangcaii]
MDESMGVPALPVATLATLGAAAIVGLGLVLLVQKAPRAAIVAFLLVIAFVPTWIELPLGFIRPTLASAVAGLTVIGLAARRPRMEWGLPDLLAGFLVVAAAGPMLFGFLTLNSFLGVFVIWCTAFVAGRLALLAVDPGWLYAAIAVIFGVVALLAVVEFQTGWHALASWGPQNGAWATWAPIQERSGLSRAEGAFGHSIALGNSLAMAAVLTLDADLSRRLRLGLIALMVAGIAVTLSRGALVSLFVGLILAVVMLSRPRVKQLRAGLAAALVVAVVAGAPFVLGVFSEAGDEASTSAEYRGDLVRLVSSIELVGRSSAIQESATGTASVGGFQSIDNQFLVFGLSYGWLTVGLVTCLFALGAVALVSGRGSVPTAALVAQVPALLTVALITQYAVFVWFVFGLACAAEQLRRHESVAEPVPVLRS